MRCSHAVARRPGPDLAAGLTTAGGPAPDVGLALAQHAACVGALRDSGLEVTLLDPLPGFADAYFVEDVAVVTPSVAVLTRPGAPSRRGEVDSVAAVLARHRTVVRIEPPGTLDGGDVLVLGGEAFVGLSDRTNADGAAQLAQILAREGVRCTTVPVAGGLHLKSSVTAVGPETLLLTAALAARPEFARFEKVVVDPADEYATNVVWVNGRLLVPAGFPRVRDRLARRGAVVELETSEVRKMDGGLTCLSIRF